MKIRFWSRRYAASLILATALAGVVSACGSTSSSGRRAVKGGERIDRVIERRRQASAPSSGASNQSPLGTVAVNKVYVPGVPLSSAQLYKSNETAPPTTSPPIAKGKFVVFVSCGQQVSWMLDTCGGRWARLRNSWAGSTDISRSIG